MTAAQIIESAYKRNPALNLAISQDGAAIGAWEAERGRYVMAAGRLITSGPNGEEQWANCPVEIWINGQPPYQPGQWVPAENVWRSNES